MVTCARRALDMDVTVGNAYMEKTAFVQKCVKNGAEMSVLYMRRQFFSMYAFVQMAYNEKEHMDNPVMLSGGEGMQRQRTVGEYRTIDLIMFAVMAAVGEWLVINAARFWFRDQLYMLSIVPLITAIVMMRWGPWAAIHALLGGAVYCFASGAAPAQYVVYCGGNLLGLAALAVLRFAGKERIRGDALLTMGFGALTVLLMQLGRALLSLLFGGTAGGMIVFFTTDVITLLFTIVVMWIVRRLDGVFEDQINYLLRVSREQEEEKENF